MVEAGDGFDDRESDTHTSEVFLLIPTLIDAVELFFDECDFFCGDSGSIVREGKDIVFSRAFDGDAKFRTQSCVLDKVREDIMQYLDKHMLIHTHIEVRKD